MDKTMTRFLAILAALTCAASAQTYRTVTADTNNAIRTNFTLGAAQVSGSFAISNITGLQSALDVKLATNGSAANLTNFPALLLTTNSSESGFPSALLRTNGDGSGLTNLPNANLSNATGVLPLANGGTGQTNAALAIEALLPAYTNNEGKVLGLDTNLTLIWTTNAGGGGSGSVTNVDASGGSTGLTFTGGPITNGGTLTLGGTLNLASGGTGATNASAARTALELGTAATNDSTAFQPASTNLDTLANNNGGALTNVSVDLTTVLPAYSNNAAKVLAVASGETNVEWIAVSNTVTDASTLTNFPASILQTNSADGSFPAFLLRTNGSAAGLTSFPTLNQNTTGTASNVTGVVAIANGGSGQTTAAAAIEALLPAYSGNAEKILALNSNATGLVWTTDAGGGGGIVNLADTTNGVTNTLGIANGGTGAGDITNARINLLPSYTGNSNKVLALNSNATEVIWATAGGGQVALGSTNVTGTLPISKGGTGGSTAFSALTNFGIYASVVTGNYHGVKLGESTAAALYSVAIGYDSDVNGGDAVGVGHNADVPSGSDYSIAIGSGASVSGQFNIAIGWLAKATNGAIQLGNGANSTGNTIQFLSAGTVNTNEWAALANAGTVGTNLLRSTNITGAQAAIFTATTTNAPTNTNAPTPDAWLDIRVGTNDYKLPLWQ